jgi:hypothetical protein
VHNRASPSFSDRLANAATDAFASPASHEDRTVIEGTRHSSTPEKALRALSMATRVLQDPDGPLPG